MVRYCELVKVASRWNFCHTSSGHEVKWNEDHFSKLFSARGDRSAIRILECLPKLIVRESFSFFPPDSGVQFGDVFWNFILEMWSDHSATSELRHTSGAGLAVFTSI